LDIPKMPAEQLQVDTVGKAGRPVLNDALTFAKIVKTAAKRYGVPLSRNSTVLDFGAGWGRISRFFIRDIEIGGLLLADPIPEILENSVRDMPGVACLITRPFPPIGLRSQSVDLIFAYSVFSHLSETAATAWMHEFLRILKPGGLACLTTRPRIHVASGGISMAIDPNASAELIERETKTHLRLFDSGEFVYLPMTRLKKLTGDFFGEAAIPESFAATWVADLPLRQMIDNYSKSYMQPIMVFQKEH
jgi:ubiquinone/menaquinone biosynthesis C-methylase UbiE